MGANERQHAAARRRAEDALERFGREVQRARLEAGVSQHHLGTSAHISATKVSRIEAGKLPSLSIMDAYCLAASDGLALSVKVFPGGVRPRDAAHAARLQFLLSHVRPPLHCRTEVPLPRRPDAPELRAWDAMVTGGGERTAIELETRLYDIQDQMRRLQLKRRDGAPDRLLLVVADTPANRRVLREYPELFADLPRLRRSEVLKSLLAGRHPPTGLVLI